MARTRGAILRAGRECLIHEGYHRLGLETVAERAGVTAVRSEIVPAMARVARTADAAGAFRSLVCELCRFWASDPDLLRRLVSLDPVDPRARDLIRRREDWTGRQVAAVIDRLAAEDRGLDPFDRSTATAIVSAVTSFRSCDEMASRTGVPLAELDTLLIPGLRGVIRLG
ncbi:MAG: helix-turn-helix transcriptional regulator [Nocardiopsaceae bacterium]|nr:helix-turn-helix transcriptional regulator [Nocardiopsaceae bacterium]